MLGFPRRYRFGLFGNWIFGCCFDMNVCASNGTKQYSLLPGKKEGRKTKKTAMKLKIFEGGDRSNWVHNKH